MGISDSQYISLQEATKFCNYSQEYLSLRARRGKLKAVKLGRNWVTTREWLKKYVKRVEDYNNQIDSAPQKSLKRKKLKPQPPKNLPLGEFTKPKLKLKDYFEIVKLNLRFAPIPILLLAVSVLMTVGGIFGRENLIRTYNDISPYTEQIGRAGDLVIEDYTKSVKGVLEDAKFLAPETRKRLNRGFAIFVEEAGSDVSMIADVFREHGEWLKSQANIAAYLLRTINCSCSCK